MENKNNKYKKIVIIGNGMDLDHGAPTSYKDIFEESKYLSKDSTYLMHKMEEIIADAKSDNWTDFENTIMKINRAWKSSFLPVPIGTTLSISEKKISKKLRDNVFETMNSSSFWEKVKEWSVKNNITDFYEQIREKDEVDRLIKSMDVDGKWKDTTYILVKALGCYLQELVKVFEIEKQNKYIGFFGEDALVINYNYTSWYEGIYFKYEDAVYVHGRIGNKSNYESINPESQMRNVDDIRLGYYDDKMPLTQMDVNDENKPQNVDGDLYYMAINKLLNYLNLSSLDFKKSIEKGGTASKTMGFEPIIKKITGCKIEELTFIGHSLSANDLIPLFHGVFNGIRKPFHIKKLTLIGYWEDKNSMYKTISELSAMHLITWEEINLINNANTLKIKSPTIDYWKKFKV